MKVMEGCGFIDDHSTQLNQAEGISASLSSIFIALNINSLGKP